MDKLYFVIHKHDATSLHYDLRLQIGKKMPSWAVPKGPSLDPTVKRLALETSDHSLEYRNFEGILPEGSYGAGPVMIWDEGVYFPEFEDGGELKELHEIENGNLLMKNGLKNGELKFRLYGKKLQGSFALVKTKGFGPKNAWLLIKHKDEYCRKGYNVNDYDFSARSTMSLEEIKVKFS